MRTCDVDGCERKHLSRGLCKMHLQRWKRHGDVTVVKKPSHPKHYPDRTCSAEGCDLARFARDLCKKHYAQRWRADTKVSDTPVCDMPNCTEPAHRYGLCQRHDEEQTAAPFYNPPPRRRTKLPVVGWEEMRDTLRSSVSFTDIGLTRGEILAARTMSQDAYDALPTKDERTLYVIVPEGQA